MKRVPILATLVVLAAVAVMIGLGLWQRDRAVEKEALLVRFQQNVAAPPLALGADSDLAANLLRPVTVACGAVSPTRIAGAGKYGFRVIADCTATGLAAPIAVQLGTQRRPTGNTVWTGGPVRGYLAPAPDSRSLLRQLFDHRPGGVMVVADPSLAGLAANPGPDLADIPNNHRSYMVQWFAFAAIALVIYALALRNRWKKA